MAPGGVRGGLLAALALAACGGPGATPPPAPTPPSAQVRADKPPPELSSPAPTPQSGAASPAADACGATPLQYLVGKPRTDIPVPLAPDRRRVVCSTCVMTQEYVPYRQTITYDANTGLVTSVRCG